MRSIHSAHRISSDALDDLLDDILPILTDIWPLIIRRTQAVPRSFPTCASVFTLHSIENMLYIHFTQQEIPDVRLIQQRVSEQSSNGA